ncbi:MAG: glycosyltransferase family 4 protein [Cyanobacteria bacterium J06592_8]
MDKTTDINPRFLWCFLKIFSCEGGIQSYVKDILDAYVNVMEPLTTSNTPTQFSSEVLLLHDPPGSPNPYENSSLEFHYLQTKPPVLGGIRLVSALLNHLILQRPQRVFCGHINLAPLIQLLCQPFGVPYTVLTYGKEVWQPLSGRYRNALEKADQIWTISRYSRDQACQANQLDPQKFRLLPCMVDGNRFTPGAKPQHLIERYGLQDTKVLMTVARLWSGDIYKGVDVTIRALPQISKQIPNVKYLVIGRGDDQPRLANLAKELGVADQVVFAGFVPTEDLVDHYRVADAYIMPSQEGFGIVYLEAMACGIPVLSGNADGSADPVQDGKLGWQVPHRDPDAVAKACIQILQGDDQRCQGEWLRQQSLAQFGQEAFRVQLRELLNLPVVS